MTKPRSIQVIPRDGDLDKKIDRLSGKLRTSRAGLASLALEFVVDALESGDAVFTNGQIEILPSPKPKAA